MTASSGAQGTLTVLYDEHCGFCATVAAWLVRSGAGRLRAEPIGSPLGARALRDLPPQRRYDTVHVVDGVGRRWSGGPSLPVLARETPGLAWAARTLELLPRVTELGYDWVARHRGMLSRLLRLARVLRQPSHIQHEMGTRPSLRAR